MIKNALGDSAIGRCTFIPYIQAIRVILHIINVNTVSVPISEFNFIFIRELYISLKEEIFFVSIFIWFSILSSLYIRSSK